MRTKIEGYMLALYVNGLFSEMKARVIKAAHLKLQDEGS